MRIDINLAKEPFTNHALYWVVLTAAYVVATEAAKRRFFASSNGHPPKRA